MAGAVNKVILIGNVGRDPELRRTAGGAPVTDFTLATTERFNDKNGQRQEQTEWHNIVVWNRLAETAAQYLKKGSSVYIEGKLRTRSWEDNGQKRYKTEIVASTFQMLDKATGGNQGGGFGGGFNQNQSQPQNFGGNQGGGYNQNRGGGFGGDTSFGEPPMDDFGGGFDDFGGMPDSGFGGGYGSAPMPNTQQPRYNAPQQNAPRPQAPAPKAPSLPIEDELPF